MQFNPSLHHPIFSLFSTRRCRICLAFAGESVCRPNSSSTALASLLSLNARSLAVLSVIIALPPGPSSDDSGGLVGKLSSCIPSRSSSIAREPPEMYRSITAKRAPPSWANCAAPRVVKVCLMRTLFQSKSCSLMSAARQTRRKDALERALMRKFRLRLIIARGWSSSGVMDSCDASSVASL